MNKLIKSFLWSVLTTALIVLLFWVLKQFLIYLPTAAKLASIGILFVLSWLIHYHDGDKLNNNGNI